MVFKPLFGKYRFSYKRAYRGRFTLSSASLHIRKFAAFRFLYAMKFKKSYGLGIVKKFGAFPLQLSDLNCWKKVPLEDTFRVKVFKAGVGRIAPVIRNAP